MKKFKVLMAVCLLTAVAVMAAMAQEHGVIASGKVNRSRFELGDNRKYGKNYQFLDGTGNVLPGDYKAKKGDTIKIHLKGKVDKPIVVGKGDGPDPMSYFAFIVDTSTPANYWLQLSGDDPASVCHKQIDSEIVIDVAYKIVTDAKANAKSNGANLIIGTSHDQKTPVTIITTDFTYEITRP